MKKLRQSEFKDYVAIDHVDSKGNIEKTTLYLQKGKPTVIMTFDHEDKRYYSTEAVFDGTQIKCKDIDPNSPSQGLNFELEIDDNLFSQVKC